MFAHTLLFYNGSASGEREGGGGQAVIRMQLTGLMLNRCDRVLGRQSQSSIMLDGKIQPNREPELDTSPRGHFFYLASHDDGAKKTLFFFNSITQQM